MSVSQVIINQYRDFYDWLIVERQIKTSTAKLYVYYHKLVCKYLCERDFDKANFLEFISDKRQTCKATYINGFIDYARVYTYYLRDRNLSYDKDLLTITHLKEIEPIKATMSDEEIEAFLKYVPERRRGFSLKYYKVWTLFFSILAYTGMRPNEVATLTIDTVDFGRNVFIISPDFSKTNNQRFVPIPPNITEKIRKHIETLDGKHLFMQNKTVFNNVDWHYNFHNRLKRLGIKRKGLTPYSLRHSYITRMIEEDVNIFKVQKLVGHSRIDTTAKYTHLTTKDMQKTILSHPVVRRGMDKKIVSDYLLQYIKTLDIDILKYQYSRNVISLRLRIR